MELKFILLILSQCAPIIALFVGRKATGHPLFYYVVAAIIIEWASFTLKYTLNQDIQWAGNIFLALEFLFFATFFVRLFNPLRKQLWWSLALLLELIFLINAFRLSFFKLNHFNASLLCMVYLILCLISYGKLMRSRQHQFIEHSSAFWITSGIFIYATITCIIFALPGLMSTKSELFVSVWNYVYLTINFVRYILIGIGLRLYSKYGY